MREDFHRIAGIDEAVAVTTARSGTHFDPAIVDAVRRDPESLFTNLADDTVDVMLDAEPALRPPLTEAQLDAALEAIADFCNLRCAYVAGRARGTADLVSAAATRLAIPAAEVPWRDVQRSSTMSAASACRPMCGTHQDH